MTTILTQGGTDGTIYAISDGGIGCNGNKYNTLYALNSDGSLKWSYNSNFPGNPEIAIGNDGTIYVATSGYTGSGYNTASWIAAINPTNGKKKWATQVSSNTNFYAFSPAISDDGTVYVALDKLYAMNSVDGSVKWSSPLTGSSPIIGSDGTIYIGSSEYLYALDPNGKQLWAFNTGTVQNSSTLGSDGTLYIGTSTQNTYNLSAIGEKRIPIPTDSTPPIVNTSDPDNTTTGISITKSVTITFSEDIQPGEAYNNIIIKDANGQTINFNKSIAGNSITLTPVTYLNYASQYTVTIPANAIKDFADNAFVNDYTLVFSTAATNKILIFNDSNLEASIRLALDKSSDSITDLDMLKINTLSATNQGIKDIAGIEYATNLKKLYLGINQINKLTPLSSLTNLSELFLSNNVITDISPLEHLTNLKQLRLGNNQISDINPLSALVNMESLHLESNQIADIQSLAGMNSLREIYLANNRVQDIAALGILTSLTGVYLANNKIGDISPLVTNSQNGGLGNNDSIELQYNNLNLSDGSIAKTGLQKLTAAGATVSYDPQNKIDECFIATAAFGSKFEPAVVLLRHFRDDYLLNNRLGRAFVKFYYHNSPPIAAYIAKNGTLKVFVTILLIPFITLVYLIYHPIFGATVVGVGVGALILLLMRSKRRILKLS